MNANSSVFLLAIPTFSEIAGIKYEHSRKGQSVIKSSISQAAEYAPWQHSPSLNKEWQPKIEHSPLAVLKEGLNGLQKQSNEIVQMRGPSNCFNITADKSWTLRNVTTVTWPHNCVCLRKRFSVEHAFIALSQMWLHLPAPRRNPRSYRADSCRDLLEREIEPYILQLPGEQLHATAKGKDEATLNNSIWWLSANRLTSIPWPTDV